YCFSLYINYIDLCIHIGKHNQFLYNESNFDIIQSLKIPLICQSKKSYQFEITVNDLIISHDDETIYFVLEHNLYLIDVHSFILKALIDIKFFLTRTLGNEIGTSSSSVFESPLRIIGICNRNEYIFIINNDT